MRGRLVIEVVEERKIVNSLYKALLPESLNPPSLECRTDVKVDDCRLVIEIQCDRVNLLRAVANSYLGIISMVIRGLEGLGYERAKATS